MVPLFKDAEKPEQAVMPNLCDNTSMAKIRRLANACL